ncbi:uncharacterized protein LOC132271143 [Cornus florida]|uniref:uncharacterized protein LOC132271143 n=1 Tax=Cornus florida TaxID=4283 RepID=UPI0028A0CA3E|nr:uncharacterized protein LOC132271143 [Cornus florida]
MSLDPGAFEALVPYRFITFTIPNPSHSINADHHLHTPLLRVAVLDSPIQPTITTDPPRVAAMIVPKHRETDWTFSTQTGHLQLLLSSPEFSRLIIVGNLPANSLPDTYNRPTCLDHANQAKLEETLTPLLIALLPKLAFKDGLPEIPFLRYEDDVVRSVVLEKCVGSCVGEMLIEDVELQFECDREFRRRLRFKRMPNLIQTQIRLVSNSNPDVISGSNCVGLGELGFKPDTQVLVHPYLTPMVASLSLISSCLDQRIRGGFRPKALCLGVGGGALLGFLNAQLGFEVIGVEADEAVLRVAKQYFGLEDGEFIQLRVGDGIELINKFSHQANEQNVDVWDAKFDVIMVDLDSSDARMGISAPPMEFVQKSVLLAARLVLNELGVLVINVIPPTRAFYETLIHEFQEVFQELYEIDVGNGENFVLIATASPMATASGDCENTFLTRLKLVISGAYIDSIRKL